MRITKTAQYALQAAADLAVQHGSGPLPGCVMAEKYGITPLFSQQILMRLKRAGIVHTVRGPRGGYILARDPSEITLLEVLEGAGKSVRLTPCTDPAQACDRRYVCSAARVWRGASELLHRYLSRTTLQDVVDSDTDGGDAQASSQDEMGG